MHGSLALKGGILYVGCHGRTAFVRPYDFDGHPLGLGFPVHGVDAARTSITGLAVDEDHRIWIADGESGRVRAFTAFGQELPGLAGREPRDADQPGSLGALADVACTGIEDDARICVASAGRRRHALQVFDRRGEPRLSLRPGGDPLGSFRGLAGIAMRDRVIWVCERRAERIQVFRDGEFHYLFRVDLGRGAAVAFEPRAVAALSDGRLVVAHGGDASALLLLEPGGRLLRVLAASGSDSGGVFEPSDLAIDERESDASTRVAVVDRDGDRVQVFTLSGRCYGSFEVFPDAAV